MKIIEQAVTIETTTKELKEMCWTLYASGQRVVKDLMMTQKRIEQFEKEEDSTEEIEKFLELKKVKMNDDRFFIFMVCKQLLKLDVDAYNEFLETLEKRELFDLKKAIEEELSGVQNN